MREEQQARRGNHVRSLLLAVLGVSALAGCGLGGQKEVMCRRIADTEIRLMVHAAGKDRIVGDPGDAKKARFRSCMKQTMDDVKKSYEMAKEAEKLMQKPKGRE